MTTATNTDFFTDYASRLQVSLEGAEWSGVAKLADDLYESWLQKKQVFFCGNGGSAGNAIHLANDLLYGVAKRPGGGMRPPG